MSSWLVNFSLKLGLCCLVALSASCRLRQGLAGTARWEIESEVPASLNTGAVSAQQPSLLAGSIVSDLSGPGPLPLRDGSMVDLPSAQQQLDGLIDIPKPDLATGGLAYQSPPELLDIPGTYPPLDTAPGETLPEGNSPTRGPGLLAPPPDVPLEVGAPAPENPIPPATPPAPAPENPADPASPSPVSESVTASAGSLIKPVPPKESGRATGLSQPFLYGKSDRRFPLVLPPLEPLPPELPLRSSGDTLF